MNERAMVPCSACARHVRCGEGPCPFCGGSVRDEAPVCDADPGAPRGLTSARTALVLAATVAASLSLAACYGGPPRPPSYNPDAPQGQRAADGGAQIAQ
jgi:hypothetical protein